MVDKNKRMNVEDDEALQNKEFLKGKDLSQQVEYGRPPVSPGLNDRTSDITFMQIDCDYYSK